MSIFTGIFGSRNQRLLKQYGRLVRQINDLEPSIQALSDEQLSAKTVEFRQRLADGASLDDLLIEAFACVREASVRSLGMRHFDAQLIGGMVLHFGKIAEMRTGEGKTLVATLAAYLNALPGEGVHIVTVNEYLASRDSQWMRPIFETLGLTVDVIRSGQDPETKRAAYAADITYGTNNEFGFDYLRDNLAFSLDDSGAAGALVCGRGRSRLDPYRRGADAADHFRAVGGRYRALQQGGQTGSAAQGTERARRSG